MIEDISKAKIIEQECKFQMLSPSKKFNKIQLPVSQLLYTQAKEGGGEGRRYPGFQVTGTDQNGGKNQKPKKKNP